MMGNNEGYIVTGYTIRYNGSLESLNHSTNSLNNSQPKQVFLKFALYYFPFHFVTNWAWFLFLFFFTQGKK